MVKIDFYYMPESPPCRAVEMVAQMVRVDLEKHYVNLFTKDQLKEDFVKLNPLHKVPFIVDGDLKIGESRAIIRYLVDRYSTGGDDSLYPKDPVKRAQVDELIFIEACTLYPAGFKLLGPKIYGQLKELDKDAEKTFRDILGYLDNRLKNNEGKSFMFGDKPTIADISLVSTFTYYEACDYDITEFEALIAYLKRLRATIPKYAEINDGPVENMRKFIKTNQEGK